MRATRTLSVLVESWTDIAILREDWGGVIMIKDIQDVQDSDAAIDVRMDGIIMSNHGASLVRVGVQVPFRYHMAPMPCVGRCLVG